nr:MAG TPA: hypothetical protein [Caudoviricetes sp.]
MQNIQGEFINTQTGQTIFVRDSIMTPEGDTIIMTDHGQMSMNEFSKYYVKMESDDIADTQPIPVVEAPISAPDDLMAMAQQDMLAEPTNKVEEFLSDVVTEYPDSLYDSTTVDTDDDPTDDIQEHTSEAVKMLDKIMSESDVKLNVKISFDESTFPFDAIDVLKQYFKLTDDDISEWLYTNVFNKYKDTIIEQLKASTVKAKGTDKPKGTLYWPDGARQPYDIR